MNSKWSEGGVWGFNSLATDNQTVAGGRDAMMLSYVGRDGTWPFPFRLLITYVENVYYLQSRLFTVAVGAASTFGIYLSVIIMRNSENQIQLAEKLDSCSDSK